MLNSRATPSGVFPARSSHPPLTTVSYCSKRFPPLSMLSWARSPSAFCLLGSSNTKFHFILSCSALQLPVCHCPATVCARVQVFSTKDSLRHFLKQWSGLPRDGALQEGSRGGFFVGFFPLKSGADFRMKPEAFSFMSKGK